MNRLLNAVGDYCSSEHFMFLDDELKEHAEGLLSYWCEQVGEEPAEADLARALGAVARLDAPVEARKAFPRLLEEFLEYASTRAAVPEAGEWLAALPRLGESHEERFREDGTVRGDTVRRAGAEVGRNDPCPCGSGRKYKKCCMPR
ncbi:MAG: SEC-C metal-binding domain-containing protein [Gemmatimonadota bacterium]